jgi:hypothetical protein
MQRSKTPEAVEGLALKVGEVADIVNVVMPHAFKKVSAFCGSLALCCRCASAQPPARWQQHCNKTRREDRKISINATT